MKTVLPGILTFPLLALVLAASPASAGTLQIYASGEDLATEGFVAPRATKDGWVLQFRHIYVAVADVTAHQTNPPFDASAGAPLHGQKRVQVPGVHIVDLVAQADDKDRVLVAEAGAHPGHYNAISWRMALADSGPSAGSSMLFIGTASKGGEHVPFRIQVTDTPIHECGEYVGDERKGFVAEGGIADLEMTFHLDHIFGREDKPEDDAMNLEAPGFAPFSGGAAVYTLSLQGLHVGHAGEGHCRVRTP